jgi:hypothetical protein
VSERLRLRLGIAILLFGAFMVARGLWKRGRTPLGAPCTIGSDECANGATCLGMGARGTLCTQVCGTCPAQMRCEVVSVRVDGAPGVAMNREYQAPYCVPR